MNKKPTAKPSSFLTALANEDGDGSTAVLDERQRDSSADKDAIILHKGQIVVRAQGRKKKGFEPESLQGLAKNIKRRGMKHPLLVKALGNNSYLLVDGERRFRATTQYLGWEKFSCRLTQDQDEWQVALTQLSVNLQRENYDPFELGEEIRRLRKGNDLTLAELAEQEGIGLSLGQLSKLESLADAPKDVRAAIASKQLSVSTYWNNTKEFKNGIPVAYKQAFKQQQGEPAPMPGNDNFPSENSPAGAGRPSTIFPSEKSVQGGSVPRGTLHAPKKGSRRGGGKIAVDSKVALPYDTATMWLEILQHLNKRFKLKLKPVEIIGDLTKKQLVALLQRHTTELHKKVV